MSRIIAVTGSNGFIGSSLLGYWDSSFGNVVPFTGNLLDKSSYEVFFQDNVSQVIVHAAGRAFGNFDQIFDDNIRAVQMLLENAVRNNVKHVVFCSSGAVYGDTGDVSVTEEKICSPNSDYGMSKLLAEEISHYYSKNFGISVVILRFPSIYGGSNRKGVLYQLQKSILSESKAFIDGDGSQKRSFLHVEDAVQAIFLASTYTGSDVFNISGFSLDINQLVSKFNECYEFETIYRSNEQVNNIVLNSEKAVRLLHFQPKHTEMKVC